MHFNGAFKSFQPKDPAEPGDDMVTRRGEGVAGGLQPRELGLGLGFVDDHRLGDHLAEVVGDPLGVRRVHVGVDGVQDLLVARPLGLPVGPALGEDLQGLGGGAVVPMAQAVMWEIFPLEERGTAMAVWGTGIMLAPILGPTLGGYIADNWSWRWIFYINLPIGVFAFFMVSAFLFDAPFHRRPRRVDVAGIVLMVVGFGCLQLVLDLGERNDWFDSMLVLMCGVLAACMLAGFVLRELMVTEPILDLTVFGDRNFGVGTLAIFLVGLGFNSSLLLLALFTQTVLGYDAWTAGLTLAPGGLGTMIALMMSTRQPTISRTTSSAARNWALDRCAFEIQWAVAWGIPAVSRNSCRAIAMTMTMMKEPSSTLVSATTLGSCFQVRPRSKYSSATIA